MEIIVITAHHKDDAAIPIFRKYFYPIQVGSALTNEDLKIYRDDLGYNISFKNRSFCELTAHYHVWKNLKYDFAGLMHYRRIFSTKSNSIIDMKNKIIYYLRRLHNFPSIKNINLYCDNAMVVDSKEDLRSHSERFYKFLNSDKFLESDIILPRKVRYAYLSLMNQYSINHCRLQFDLFNEIIIKNYPEFQDTIELVNKDKGIYPYNMFVMKKTYYNEYHEMLFSILFQLERLIDLDAMSLYQRRIFGFLSERFLNYYIAFKKKSFKNIKIIELPTIFVADNLK